MITPTRIATLAGAALLFFAAAASSQVTAVVLEPQNVPGVGNVTSVSGLAINDDGDWVVEVDTDNPDTDADGALLDGGGLLLREGQALSAPFSASVGSFDTINLDNRDASRWNLFLDGTTGSNDNSGVFLGDTLLVQEGDVSPAPQFGPGADWQGFFGTLQNDSGQLVVLGTVDDPNIASSVDQAFVLYDLDHTGAIVAENVLYKEGDVLPGQVESVAVFRTGPHDSAFNDAGQLLFVADLTGPTASDHAVYLDDLLLAQEGSPSPVLGRTWSSLSSAKVDVNNCGDTVFSGSLDGDTASNAVIVKNGFKFMQEGDSPAAIAPFKLTSFGSGPVQIGETGSVLWYGDWDDPDTDKDTGLFLDGTLIVQEGVTQVGGVTIDILRGIQDGYALSPYGEWIIFEAILDDGNEGAFVLGGGPWKGLGHGLAGSGGVVPCHTALGSLSGGASLTLSLDDATPLSSATLVFSITELHAPFKGGTLVPFPEFLVAGLPTGPFGSVDLPVTFPMGVPAGIEIFTQFWISDAGGPAGFSASNALSGTTD